MGGFAEHVVEEGGSGDQIGIDQWDECLERAGYLGRISSEAQSRDGRRLGACEGGYSGQRGHWGMKLGENGPLPGAGLSCALES